MEITEVRIKLTENSDDRLQAFCSITFDDCFVVRDLKIIGGANGPFVAMPSRKLTSHCHRCGCKNHLRASYCNQCGTRLNPDRAGRDSEGRAKLYADIAHPINSKCRETIQEVVISAFRREMELAKEPGYVSRYDDDYDDDFSAAEVSEQAERGTPSSESPSREQPEISASSPKAPEKAPSDPSSGSSRTEFQRTDAEPAEEPPRPHGPIAGQEKGKDTSQQKPSQGTPHSNIRKNPGFGAGILDD